MASTINATTSGVVTTGDSVATLSLQTGGTTAVAIDTAQIVTLSKSLALLGSSSGSVSIAAPATAGTQSYTLPTAVPAVNGYALTATTGGVMSWAAASATPGGSTTQVQYNNAGSFAGSANMTFDGTTLTAAGFSGPHNGTVGATTANTGAFTTLSASSTVSGTGFSTYLASPPAIGGTAAAAGTFTAGTFTSTVHKGATSGTITLAAPAVAGTQSYTLPTAVPAVSGYALTSTTAGVMSWAATGSGSPGGSTTQVQYNNAGAFGGVSGFTTDGTRVTASTTIGVGGATPSTSGAGITFPATQSASTEANTLDDYEEGTYTPTLTADTGTYTYTATGSYTKVGRMIYFSAQAVVTGGSGTGNAYISVPFTSSSAQYGGYVLAPFGVGAAAVYPYCQGKSSDTLFTLYYWAAGTRTGLGALISNGTTVNISGVYQTT